MKNYKALLHKRFHIKEQANDLKNSKSNINFTSLMEEHLQSEVKSVLDPSFTLFHACQII